VLVKYGFHDVVQKSNLASYLPGSWGKSELSSYNTAQRMRMAMEELGPTFIKLGQLLASRPDIIPPAFVDEFKKLQDQVPALSFDKLLPVLEEQFPTGLHTIFKAIDEKPLGSASIAQVHRAELLSGEQVVLKVQKPGLLKTIREDMNILFFIAELFDIYVPELKVFNPTGLAREFSYNIEMETNFVVEANNVRRFAENFKGHPTVKIPKPYIEMSGSQVLVLEYMHGSPLTDLSKFKSPEEREKLMRAGLQAYFAMVFKDGLFHGDLHAGNIIALDDDHLAFIDFGMVGRLSKRVQTSIANMFISLANEDYDRLAYEYIELSTQSIDVERDEFARDLRLLLSPFFGLTLKSVNMGKMLIDSSAIAFKHKVYLPSELLLFFKSIVTIEGLGRTIKDDFDILPYVYDFSAQIVKLKYDPGLFMSDISAFSREMSSLMRVMPGELKNYVRKINNPHYAKQIEIKGLDEMQRLFANISHLIFFSIIVASLVIGGALCVGLQGVHAYYGISLVSLIMFSMATFFGFIGFYHYVKK
jgi:ubiquinone biosynthesis protein